MPLNTQSYSDIIKAEFEKKRTRNPVYSLRAFARDLNIGSSTASMLLRGQVGLSQKRAKEIAGRLGFSGEETLYFLDLIRAKRAKREKARNEALLNLRQYNTRFNCVDNATFHHFSKWYALPLMELIRMFGPAANAAFLARKLKISQEEIRKALRSFRAHKILRRTKGHDEVTEEFISLPDGQPDTLVRQFHVDILEKAKLAATSDPNSERNIACAIVRMRKTDLAWAAQEMKVFRRKLAARLEQGDGHDAVYAIGTQLFRLDND